jgi:hypothetical protein
MRRTAREIDLDPRTFVGLSFPLRADTNNNFALTRNSLQQAQYNLKNLLLTHIGERVMHPTFGCKLLEVCFEQHDDELPNRVDTVVRESVEEWLPYINIESVDVLKDEGNPNRIFVKVSFFTTLDESTMQQITIDAQYGRTSTTRITDSNPRP